MSGQLRFTQQQLKMEEITAEDVAKMSESEQHDFLAKVNQERVRENTTLGRKVAELDHCVGVDLRDITETLQRHGTLSPKSLLF